MSFPAFVLLDDNNFCKLCMIKCIISSHVVAMIAKLVGLLNSTGQFNINEFAFTTFVMQLLL